MLRPTPPLHVTLRALFAGLLVCVLALQVVAVPARAADDSAVAALRCADANPDTPPVDPPATHCKLCGAAQAIFFFIVALGAGVTMQALPARTVHATPRPPGGFASAGWGSSWSSQAPPA